MASANDDSSNLPSGPARPPKGLIPESVRPLLAQAKLNLKIWAPFLENTEERRRRVKYRASESRTGLKWTIALPRQCWQCQTTQDLACRDFSSQLRAFDSPTSILVGSLGGALLLLLPTLLGWGGTWILALLCPLVGAGALWAKSWRERVRISMCTCSSHAADMRPPDLVIHEEQLYVYAPSLALAEAAHEELLANRRQEQRYSKSAGERSANLPADQADEPAGPPPSMPLPRRTQLPPIKLAGDEEDSPGG
jgi:hypothetical protein